MKKTVFALGGLCLLLASPLQAETVDCQAEYQALTAISRDMAALDPTNVNQLQDLDRRIGEAEPKYQACMNAYEQKHGADARAQLDVQLATQNV